MMTKCPSLDLVDISYHIIHGVNINSLDVGCNALKHDQSVLFNCGFSILAVLFQR